MASIRKINNHYHIDYYDEAGKRHRVALGIKASRENYRLAVIELKKIEYELSAGIYLEKQKRDKADKNMEDAYEAFIKTKDKLSEKTKTDYKWVYEKFTKHTGNISIKKITSEIVDKWEEQLRIDEVSDNGIASYYKKLRVIFNYYKSLGWIQQNPIPKKEMIFKEPVVIPRKDLEDILDKLRQKKNRKHYKVIVMLLLTGMRISELIRLTFDDIDFRENILVIRNTKGRRDDKFPLYYELRNFILEEFPDRTGRLFDYKSKESMKFFKKFLIKEGYGNYNFHNLRKTFISKLINSGMSVYDVMTLARHKSLQTTLRHYTSAELSRMGKEISERANLGTILGTIEEKPLKRLIFKQKQRNLKASI